MTALPAGAPLTHDQVGAFWRDGHILLRGLLSPDQAATVRAAIVEEAEGQFARQDGRTSFGGAESERHFADVIARHDLPVAAGESCAAGDCAFHLGWTVHGADANRSDRAREAAVVTFYPDSTRVDELTNEAREYDARVFLGGRRPGEPAESERNPVVWLVH